MPLCLKLLFATKITHKISSHKSYIPNLLSLFTNVLVLLTSVKLALFIYINYADVYTMYNIQQSYNSHTLECSLSFDLFNIFYNVLQYSMFKCLATSSCKIALINSRDLLVPYFGKKIYRRCFDKVLNTPMSCNVAIRICLEVL